MNANEIQKLCRLGENSRVQFKLRLENPAKIAPELVAFANSKGGILIIGIEDKTGKIIGISYEQAQQMSTLIGQVANEWVNPTIYLDSFLYNRISDIVKDLPKGSTVKKVKSKCPEGFRRSTIRMVMADLKRKLKE